MMKLTRPAELRRRSKVTSSNNAIRNPAMLTTDSERVTIDAGDLVRVWQTERSQNAKRRRRDHRAEEQRRAKPASQARINRVEVQIIVRFRISRLSVKLIDRRQQTDLWRRDLRLRQLSRIAAFNNHDSARSSCA